MEEQPLPEVPCNDPTQFCRLCFSDKRVHWVIRTCGTEVDMPFVNTIGECLGIWLSLEEDFPCAVCRRCTKRLEGILAFRESSRRCDEALKAKRQDDPSALVLFYDYPEDKVFINGADKPGAIRDDPDFEAESILPEVVLDEGDQEKKTEEEPPVVPDVGVLQMSRADKQKALQSYMTTYLAWSSDAARNKDDDEITVAAPEALEFNDDQPELSVLYEKYLNPQRVTPLPLKKQIPLSRYTCCFCQQSFRTKAILQGHKIAVHTNSRQNDLECLDCGQTFVTVSAMKLHAIRHRRDLLISCQTCGIQFVSNNELKAHLKNNGCRLMTFGKCQYCDRTFSRRGRYIFHLKKLHPDKPLPAKDDDSPQRSQPALPRVDPAPIERDGRFVVMLDPLPDEVVDACEATTSSEKLVCTLCYEQFFDLAGYNTHLTGCFIPEDMDLSEPPPAPYKLCDCDTCREIFEAVDPFVEHLREHAEPLQIKPHDCVQCSGRKPKFLMHPHSPSMILGD